jgi:flagellar hook assembly protein FlgD
LEVFNVLGQRVRTLISGLAHPAGSFEAVWDGRDDQGYAVGSGAYLYRLKAGDFTETRKMVMLK